MKRGKSRHKRKKSRLLWIAIAVIGMAAITVAVCVAGMFKKEEVWKTPEELLVEYMNHIPAQEYEQMYAMLHIEASGNVSQEDFIKRNSAIYEGIEIQNMAVEIIAYDEEQLTVTYQTSFDTVAGEISFENEAFFLEGEDGYKLVWDNSLIFPNLASTDKVRVSTTQANRGEILDRNGRVLAGKGTASSVGIVPGKLENREEAIAKIAELLETTPEVIEKKLSAQWVKDDSFVPIKTIPRVEEIELLKVEPDEDVLKEKERHESLLAIPGVMISDVEVREYPLGEAAAHLVGYVQSVTAEDLEEHAGEGYTANSVIGRSGMEGLFEKELKGQNGCRIYTFYSFQTLPALYRKQLPGGLYRSFSGSHRPRSLFQRPSLSWRYRKGKGRQHPYNHRTEPSAARGLCRRYRRRLQGDTRGRNPVCPCRIRFWSDRKPGLHHHFPDGSCHTVRTGKLIFNSFFLIKNTHSCFDNGMRIFYVLFLLFSALALTWVIIVTRMVSLIRCARLLGRFRCGRGLRRCYGRLRRRRDLGRCCGRFRRRRGRWS